MAALARTFYSMGSQEDLLPEDALQEIRSLKALHRSQDKTLLGISDFLQLRLRTSLTRKSRNRGVVLGLAPHGGS